MTPQERLAAIDKAIEAVLIAGQEYWFEGMKVRRADLPAIYKMRQDLAAEIAAMADGSTAVAVFEGR